MRKILAFLLCLAQCACAPVQALNGLVPSQGYEVFHNLAYGPDVRQALDLYVPEQAKADAPLVVFFYGGSWQMGKKEDYLFVGQSMAALGYPVAVIDYRVYPTVKYPAFLHDSAEAVAWLVTHGKRYGVTTKSIYLMGHSAGAYNAVMLALNKRFLRDAGVDMARVKGVIGLAGPYDFLPLTDPKLIDIFSPEPDIKKSQPINYVRAHAPRMLLQTGTADSTVSPKNSRHLYAELKALGNDVTLKEYDGVGHYGIAAGLATPIPWNTQVRNDIQGFIGSAQK